MRGLQRLANATQSVLKDMDDEAGAVADELIAAQAETKEVIAGFKGVVGDIRANNQAVRDVLAQITNGPPVPLSASGS
jgi:hypothetical protein